MKPTTPAGCEAQAEEKAEPVNEIADANIAEWQRKTSEADIFPRQALEDALRREVSDLERAESDIKRLNYELREREANAAMHRSRVETCRAFLNSLGDVK
jgi:hypothetical protein